MTNDKIYEIAQKAGMTLLANNQINALGRSIPDHWIIEFARLVIEEDRNKICAYIEEDHSPYDRADKIVDAIRSGAI